MPYSQIEALNFIAMNGQDRESTITFAQQRESNRLLSLPCGAALIRLRLNAIIRLRRRKKTTKQGARHENASTTYRNRRRKRQAVRLVHKNNKAQQNIVVLPGLVFFSFLEYCRYNNTTTKKRRASVVTRHAAKNEAPISRFQRRPHCTADGRRRQPRWTTKTLTSLPTTSNS